MRLDVLAHQGTKEQLAALQAQLAGREQRLEVLQQDKAYLSREVELLAGQIKEQKVCRQCCAVGLCSTTVAWPESLHSAARLLRGQSRYIAQHEAACQARVWHEHPCT